MSWCFKEIKLDVCLFVSTIVHSKYITATIPQREFTPSVEGEGKKKGSILAPKVNFYAYGARHGIS